MLHVMLDSVGTAFVRKDRRARVERRPSVEVLEGRALLAGGTVINFDDFFDRLPRPDTLIVTNEYPEATFSGDPAFPNSLVPATPGSQPFSLGAPTGPHGRIGRPYNHPLYVDFTSPVNELRFLRSGIRELGKVAEIRVFEQGTLTATVPIIGDGKAIVPIIDDSVYGPAVEIDLSMYHAITRIEIVNITNRDGLVWDDFSFEPSRVIHLENLAADNRLHIDASPRMPDIKAQIIGIDAATAATLAVDWQATISFFPSDDSTKNADAGSASTLTVMKKTIGTKVTFTQDDIPGGAMQGGRLKLTATMIINNEVVVMSLDKLTDKKTHIMVVGDNPSLSVIQTLVTAKGIPTLAAGSTPGFGQVVMRIISHESGNRQFSGVSPVFSSGKDGGVGLMQLTLKNRSYNNIWNWKTNVTDGFNLLAGNLEQANRHHRNARRAITPQQLAALAKANNLKSVTFAIPTADQLLRDAVSLFGPNSRYYHRYRDSNNQFVVTPNGDGTGTVRLNVVPNTYVSVRIGI